MSPTPTNEPDDDDDLRRMARSYLRGSQPQGPAVNPPGSPQAPAVAPPARPREERSPDGHVIRHSSEPLPPRRDSSIPGWQVARLILLIVFGILTLMLKK